MTNTPRLGSQAASAIPHSRSGRRAHRRASASSPEPKRACLPARLRLALWNESGHPGKNRRDLRFQKTKRKGSQKVFDDESPRCCARLISIARPWRLVFQSLSDAFRGRRRVLLPKGPGPWVVRRGRALLTAVLNPERVFARRTHRVFRGPHRGRDEAVAGTTGPVSWHAF